MQFSCSQYLAAMDAGDRLLAGNWRGLFVRNREKRLWLVQQVIEAYEQEAELHCGAENPDSDGRREMVAAIRERVLERNQKCGIVIETLIITAIITWLIHRLLDWIFLKAPRPGQE